LQTAVRKAGAKSKGAAVADEAEGEVEGVVYKVRRLRAIAWGLSGSKSLMGVF
jgi:hypothetical protein